MATGQPDAPDLLEVTSEGSPPVASEMSALRPRGKAKAAAVASSSADDSAASAAAVPFRSRYDPLGLARDSLTPSSGWHGDHPRGSLRKRTLEQTRLQGAAVVTGTPSPAPILAILEGSATPAAGGGSAGGEHETAEVASAEAAEAAAGELSLDELVARLVVIVLDGPRGPKASGRGPAATSPTNALVTLVVQAVSHVFGKHAAELKALKIKALKEKAMGWLFYDALDRPLPASAETIGKRLQSHEKVVMKECDAAVHAARARRRPSPVPQSAAIETEDERICAILARPYDKCDGFGPAVAADVGQACADDDRDINSEHDSFEAEYEGELYGWDDEKVQMEKESKKERRRRMDAARAVLGDRVEEEVEAAWKEAYELGRESGLQMGRVKGWFARKYRHSDPGPWSDGHFLGRGYASA